MNSNILGYFFKAAWTVPIPNIFITDNAFCRTLFDDPINTESNIDANGFTIQKIGYVVVINQLYLTIHTNDLDMISSIYEKIHKKLHELNPSHGDLTFSAYSLEVSLEILDYFNQESSAEWLANKFIKPNISIPQELNGYVTTSGVSVSFTIENPEDKIQYLFDLQPRHANNTALFIKVSKTTPDIISLDFSETISKSFSELRDFILNQGPKIFLP